MQNDIAIVGMLCHVPGAKDIDSFWELLTSASEGLRALRDDEVNGQQDQENVVMAGGFIDDIDLFDAERFSFNAQEATMMDPQHRLWLQACHALLEITGMASVNQASIGVFASAGPPSYVQLLTQEKQLSHQSVLLGNVADCLATRVAYHLGLTGPSMTIQCGCSSSLVAVHQARMALLARQCDAAMVGGIHLILPAYQGYTYVEGGFASPDGHCRPFSDDAAGTVLASGYGVVMLKRLADAQACGDTIFAVIKGSAVNNDGADKASFTAPSVNGQAQVIAKALRVAGLQGNTIQYIEAHGTATPLGDPIEFAALEQGLGARGVHGSCWIGSVKANIGHLDVAAGIIGLIKASLMLHHKTLPAQIHFKAWNPKFTQHRFQVAATTQAWVSETPRCAGVSAFGFGGTNAHVILEEAPSSNHTNAAHPRLSKLFVLSAPSLERLWHYLQIIKNYVQQNTHGSLSSLLYSLQVGRKQYPYRLLLVVNSMYELLDVLERVSQEDFTLGTKTGEFQVTHKSLYEVQKAWLSGLTLNWQAGYEGLLMSKVILPPLPPLQQSYWFTPTEADTVEKLPDTKTATTPATSIYRSFWQEIFVTPDEQIMALQPLLLISSPHNQSMQHLSVYFDEQHIAYDWVVTGEEFKQQTPHCWQINPNQEDDLQRLMILWEKKGAKLPQYCIVALDGERISETPTTSHQMLLNLCSAPMLLRQLKILTIVTHDMYDINQVQPHVDSAIYIGLGRSIGQEYAHIRVQLLDLDSANIPKHPMQIVQSMGMSSLSDVAVWRQEYCWQSEFKAWQVQPYGSSTYFSPGGVYVITGGLGDVASVYVEFLARTYQAHLILVGRTSIPAEDTWGEVLHDASTASSMRKKIARLTQWRAQDYFIQVYGADVTNQTQMENVFAQVYRAFGRIDGVIHVAGAGADLHYKILHELTWAHCWQLFAPKLRGIKVLADLASHYQLKQCVVVSSISSCLTGIGLGAYGASHNMLDAIVKSQYPHWLIMNWDAWNFYQADAQAKEYGALGEQIEQFAISFDQGLAILNYVFQHEVMWRQIYISLTDLNQRYYYWARRGFAQRTPQITTRHPRPKLMTEYSVPVTDMQKQLARLWQNLLGIEPVGIHDNFFELGGHSLLALSFIQNMNTEMQLSCAVVDLFSAPTIAQLALKFDSSEAIAVSAVTARIAKQLEARKTRQAKGLHYVND